MKKLKYNWFHSLSHCHSTGLIIEVAPECRPLNFQSWDFLTTSPCVIHSFIHSLNPLIHTFQCLLFTNHWARGLINHLEYVNFLDLFQWKYLKYFNFIETNTHTLQLEFVSIEFIYIFFIKMCVFQNLI